MRAKRKTFAKESMRFLSDCGYSWNNALDLQSIGKQITEIIQSVTQCHTLSYGYPQK